MRMAFVVSALYAAMIASPVLAQGQATVQVAQSEKYGAYLTDAQGRPLYLFTTDKPQGAQEARITCTSEACLNAWPLFTTTGEPKAGAQANEAMLSTITYQGKKVVTYNGWPLYYFARDEGQKAPQGQDIESFGGEWYLVRPSGEKVEAGS